MIEENIWQYMLELKKQLGFIKDYLTKLNIKTEKYLTAMDDCEELRKQDLRDRRMKEQKYRESR